MPAPGDVLREHGDLATTMSTEQTPTLDRRITDLAALAASLDEDPLALAAELMHRGIALRLPAHVTADLITERAQQRQERRRKLEEIADQVEIAKADLEHWENEYRLEKYMLEEGNEPRVGYEAQRANVAVARERWLAAKKHVEDLQAQEAAL